MSKATSKRERRKKIHRRIRSSLRGTSERPRLSIYKSNKHIYAQLVNDLKSHTLVSASTEGNEMKEQLEGKSRKEKAQAVGNIIAKEAGKMGIEKAVFDRSGYKYHGVVKALAEGAREGGLDF
ncbi:MAG TPA: 50S ribosomal protein L18 [Balneolaceae bacterium]|nr:50S ribosomal protein L18 [Balneolaceae bacterium]